MIDKEFGRELSVRIEKVKNSPFTQPLYNIFFEKPIKKLKYVVLQEDIAQGQRVESFRITADFTSGSPFPIYQGTCIGNKKICQLQDPFAEQNPLQDDSGEMISRLQVRVTAARDEVLMRAIKVYGEA